MILSVVLAIAGAWLLLAVLTTVACAALARGGLHEDRARGYAPERAPELAPEQLPEPREPLARR